MKRDKSIIEPFVLNLAVWVVIALALCVAGDGALTNKTILWWGGGGILAIGLSVAGIWSSIRCIKKETCYKASAIALTLSIFNLLVAFLFATMLLPRD